jgi:hypothetical protein
MKDGRFLGLRIDEATDEWLSKFGPNKSEVVRMAIEYFREGRDMSYLEDKIVRKRIEIEDAKDLLRTKEKELTALEIMKTSLEVMTSGYIEERARIMKVFKERGRASTIGWLGGPANQELLVKAKFSTPEEAVAFCESQIRNKA